MCAEERFLAGDQTGVCLQHVQASLEQNCKEIVWGGRWGCNMRVFYLGDTDEDEMLQVFISKMTVQLS